MLIGVLIGASLLAVGIGAATLSQATMGAGLVALGCWLAILARIAQAGRQEQRLLEALEAGRVGATLGSTGTAASSGARGSREVLCPACGETNDGKRVACWSCGAALAMPTGPL